MEFTLKIKVPSGKIIRIKEIKNKDYFTILKFCENIDLEGLNNTLEHVLFEDNVKSQNLSILDKFYALLYARMVFIDPNLLFIDKNQVKINFNVQNILEKIDLFEDNLDKAVKVGDFTVELGLPNLLYFNNINDLYISVIKNIMFSFLPIVWSPFKRFKFI